MDGGRARFIQRIGQMRGQPGHGVQASLKGVASGAGGPLVGNQGGPETVEDGAKEDPAGHLGADTEQLEDAHRCGRCPRKPRENFLRGCRQSRARRKVGEAANQRVAAKEADPIRSPPRGP